MRVTIASVGHARTGLFRELHEYYVRRLRWPVVLREIEARQGLRGTAQRTDEGRKLLATFPRHTRLVALAETGRSLSSREFAEWIGQVRDEGTGDLAFAIGGADGLDPAVIDRADLVLSLGKMTWPHLLARGLLAEQLYRAQQILAGHPYHRD